ncbi:MAG: RDD family protein [Bacillota bacterium]
MPKADLLKRFIAALIDGLIGAVPSMIPVIGPIIGSAYILTKDALIYELTQNEEFRNRSIGKKLMSLEVSALGEEGTIDWSLSIKRNIPLAIGSIIAIIPIIGTIIGGLVALVIGIIEAVLVLTDSSGRRIGDKFAETQVIESEPEPADS